MESSKYRFFRKLILVTFLFAISSSAFALRCDGKIVQLGYTDYEVKLMCGEPVESSLIGYQVNEEGTHEFKIERWFYRYQDSKLYILEFVGGILVKLERAKSR